MFLLFINCRLSVQLFIYIYFEFILLVIVDGMCNSCVKTDCVKHSLEENFSHLQHCSATLLLSCSVVVADTQY